MKTHLLCRLLGHRLCPDARKHGHFDLCLRCHQEAYDLPQPAHIQWLRQMRWRLHDVKVGFLAWFQPCYACGRRFGRHDDSIDHLPF
jgi:hypothetical protein